MVTSMIYFKLSLVMLLIFIHSRIELVILLLKYVLTMVGRIYISGFIWLNCFFLDLIFHFYFLFLFPPTLSATPITLLYSHHLE